MIIQAEIGQFLGITAVMGMAYYLDVGLIVAACWLIGYIAAWHALQSYDEDDARLLGMVWGIGSRMRLVGRQLDIGLHPVGQFAGAANGRDR